LDKKSVVLNEGCMEYMTFR